MALPFSIGDVVEVYNIAAKAYHAWNVAGEEYSDIANSLQSIDAILRRIETEASTSHSILDTEELDTILFSTKDTIHKLESIVTQNMNLGSGWQGSWERLSFGMKDLEPLRKKIAQDLIKITAYQASLHTGSLGRIERQTGVYHEETQASLANLALQVQRLGRPSSIMTKYDNDDTRVWRQLRRDFVGKGMRSSTMQKYTPQIQKLLRDLSEQERLGDVPDEGAEEEVDDAEMLSVGAEQGHGQAYLRQTQDAGDFWMQSHGPQADYGDSHAEYMHSANPEIYTTLVDGQGGEPMLDDMYAESESRSSRTGWKRPWAKKRSNSGFLRK